MWDAVDGKTVQPLGQGTWQMGEEVARQTQEIEALRAGFEHNLWLVDTAEEYAEGGAERVVGQAIRDVRDRVFLTTKVWPTHASRDGILAALDASLKRLGTDYVDLYLLHWPSRQHPLAESMEGLMEVKRRGLTRYIGVSNFPSDLWEKAWQLTQGAVVVNQVEYSLLVRTPEKSLLGFAARHRASLMAYSPLRDLFGDALTPERRALLERLAVQHGVTPAAIGLAWVLHPRSAPVVAIAKAARLEHVRANAQALGLTLSPQEMDALHQLYQLPPHDLALEEL